LRFHVGSWLTANVHRKKSAGDKITGAKTSLSS
jgi:hypothetical protein